MSKPNYSSLSRYINFSCTQFKSKPAFVIRRKVNLEKVTYGQIPKYLNRIETLLISHGINSKEKVLFWGMNCPEYSLGLLTVMTTGRVAVPVDWRNNPDTIEKIIAQTQPKIAFVSQYFKYQFLEDLGIKCIIIEDLLKTLPHAKKIYHQENQSNLVEIVYTSGTTGIPKGVTISAKNILANLQNVAPFLPDVSGARLISILPLSHMLEQTIGLFLAFGYGATIHYLPRINSFRLLLAFKEYQPTHLIVVPELLKILWRKIEEEAVKNNQDKKLKTGLSIAKYLPMAFRKQLFKQIHQKFGGHLKVIACGGAPLDPLIAQKWFLLGLPIIEGYGATEITAIAAVNDWRHPKIGSAGKVIDNTRITTDSNSQLIIKSSSVSRGYYQNLSKTKEVFTQKGYQTGDIGFVDKLGFLYIKGRDFFKLVLASGEKIYVEDLESKIKQDQRVIDACVVSRKVNNSDTVHAYIILQNKSDDLKTIINSINDSLESKQLITSYELWPETDFPRTSTLKIDRQLVNKSTNQEKDPAQENPVNPSNLIYSDITDIISKVSGVDKTRILDTDTLANDLSINSLSRVELVALAEEYLEVVLDETKISAKTTVADIKNMIANSETVKDIKIPSWQFTPLGQIIHRLILSCIFHPLHTFFVTLKYESNIPKIKPGSIILFNHPGFLDGLCVTRTLFHCGLLSMITNSDAKFWGKETFLSRVLETTVGGIPLFESGHGLMETLKTDADLLDKGYSLLFAPQGTLQTSDADLPFKLGIGYIVQMLNRPVYIIKIKNYRDIWPVPEGGFWASTFTNFFPKKRGTALIHCSPEYSRDWSTIPPIQITNLLEEKYRQL